MVGVVPAASHGGIDEKGSTEADGNGNGTAAGGGNRWTVAGAGGSDSHSAGGWGRSSPEDVACAVSGAVGGAVSTADGRDSERRRSDWAATRASVPKSDADADADAE